MLSRIRLHLHEVSKAVKLSKAKNSKVAVRDWGKGKRGLANQWI